MKKRKQVFLLSLFFLFTGCANFGSTKYDSSSKSSDERNAEYFNFRLKHDNTYAISLKKMPENTTDILVPSQYNGKKISEIEPRAFYDRWDITSIVIPSSVESIGASAFSLCYHFNNVVLPNTLKNIDSFAFQGCDTLEKVNYEGTISQWVTINFGNNYSNPLYMGNLYLQDELYDKENILLENPDKIGNFAFANCSFLKTVIIPDSVKSIGNQAFLQCDSLNIYCEAIQKPQEWDISWNCDRPTYWNGQWSYVDGVPTPNR